MEKTGQQNAIIKKPLGKGYEYQVRPPDQPEKSYDGPWFHADIDLLLFIRISSVFIWMQPALPDPNDPGAAVLFQLHHVRNRCHREREK